MGMSGRNDSDPWRRAQGDPGPGGRGRDGGGQSARGSGGRIPPERAPGGNDRGPSGPRRDPAPRGPDPFDPVSRDGRGGFTGRGRSGGTGSGQADGPRGREGFGRAGDFGARGGGTADRGGAPGVLRAGPALRWIGAWPARLTIYILLAATLLGVIGTVLTGSEPGFLLGFLVLVGSVIATLGIQRNALYVVFPLPALTYFIGAVVTGGIHDRGIDTSKTELGASFLQWIASVFFWMCATTILVLLIAGARWLLSKQFVSGQFQMSAAQRGGGQGPRTVAAPARRTDRDQRPGSERDPWNAADPWGDRMGPGGPAGQRANRDQRDGRDIWGGRRPPNPRPPGSGPQPSGLGQQGNQPDRGNRGLPPDRPSRGQPDRRGDQNPRETRGQRPNRDQRDPRDPWAQR
jgi:hypothetical protein